MIYSFSNFGYEGSLVSVESDVRRGIPACDIVGLADAQVKETRERVQCAFKNSNVPYPTERVLISLSPCDLRKEGCGFDLPICVSVICANEQKELPYPTMIMGETELNGSIRAVKGVFACVQNAISNGISHFILPLANKNEVSSIEGINVLFVSSLSDCYSQMFDSDSYESVMTESEETSETETVVNGIAFNDEQYEEIKGTTINPRFLKALIVAISGHHHILGVGRVGNGKTMTVQKLPMFLPRLTKEEKESVSRIFSLSGLLSSNRPSINYPPFRMPHQTASIEGICGGGASCRPGEISLSHNGILFLDETAEFRCSVLQMLRVPMESKQITLSRAGRTTVYPSNFTFIGATNPCPCGNLGDKERICLCSLKSIEQYWKKFSAPLIDRCIVCDTNAKNDEERVCTYSTEEIRKCVANATKIQREKGVYNADLSPIEILELQNNSSNEVRNFAQKKENELSPRRIAMLWKVALTIANLDNRKEINLADMNESFSLVKNFEVLEDVGLYTSEPKAC